jgi:O-acetyl-ADP-ribose deacetylase (regulator of RNase III)
VNTISFPSISTGVYGYPVEEAAEIAVRTVASSVKTHGGVLREVKLVQFSSSDARTYMEAAQKVFGKSASAG